MVNFDPTRGREINKTRPALVISSNAVGKLPIKLIAPLADWKSAFGKSLWHVKIIPDRKNGLNKTSTVDALQLRGVDVQRFIHRLGSIQPDTMEDVIAAIAAVIEFQ